VQVGTPTEADALHMLLSAAGVRQAAGAPAPPEAAEVVRLCNRLPLAVGIAGKLLKDMGVRDSSHCDWSGVLAIMREELGSTGGQVGLGRIAAVCHRASASYQIC
jgi:hypothetical protein